MEALGARRGFLRQGGGLPGACLRLLFAEVLGIFAERIGRASSGGHPAIFFFNSAKVFCKASLRDPSGA